MIALYIIITAVVCLVVGGFAGKMLMQKVFVKSEDDAKDKFAKAADLKVPVYYAEFDMEMLFNAFGSTVVFEEIPKYPEVRRDLSLVLNKEVSFRQIEELAYNKERKLLQSVNVFDLYEGDKIEKGKKAYSISFLLQDKEQTLTDKVIDNTMTKLIASFENELGAIIRK